MGNAKSNHVSIPKLKEDEISYHENCTRFSAHEVLQLHSAYRKRCLSDGSVEKEDFIDMFSNYIKSAKALLFLDHVFRTWDFETNGNLSKYDVCVCVCASKFFEKLGKLGEMYLG